MAEPFRVDPTVLADAVARMAEFGRHVEELVAEIESLVTRLHVTWTGEGAAAHAEAQRHWAAGEAMMRQALAQLTAAGQSAHANYTGAMATNLGMWLARAASLRRSVDAMLSWPSIRSGPAALLRGCPNLGPSWWPRSLLWWRSLR